MSANDSESPLAKVGHRQATLSEALVHPYKGFWLLYATISSCVALLGNPPGQERTLEVEFSR